MKKLLLFTLFFAFLINTQAQRDEDWFISVGFNTINNLQSQNPFYKPGEWALENPFAIAVERKIVKRFYIEAAYTLNGFKAEDNGPDLRIDEDYTYSSLDFHAKLYFGDQIFKNTDWLDMYLSSGLGFFSIDDSLTSFNLGLGFLCWLNRKKSIGIRLQSIAKVALGDSPNPIDSNHYQYHLQAVFRL